MIHSFKAGDNYFVLDVDTGSLHMLDELAYDVVNLYENNSQEGIFLALRDKYSPDEIADVYGELTELKASGALFTDLGLESEAPEDTAGVIKSMCLHIAHDCQLRCRYCFASTGTFHGSREFMSAQVGKKALDLLVARSGNRKFLEVDFFGGEPMMNFDVVKELVLYGRELEKASGKTFRFTITTNAVELSDDQIEWINGQMENVVLSIDGRKSVHDRMRPDAFGKGSYDISVANSKKMAAARGDKSYYVRGTFTHENLDFSNDVMSLVSEGFDQISMEPVVMPEGSPLRITRQDLPEVFAQYDKLMGIYLDQRKNGKWFNFFHFNIDLDGGPCVRRRLTGCGAGSEYVAVTPKGDIYPCHQFVGRPGYKMGDVFSGAIDENMRAEFAKNHVFNKPECRDCWAHFYCSGGCAANAQAANGSIFKPDEMQCLLQKKRIECALAINAIEKKRELTLFDKNIESEAQID